jgi:hypothetical protein
MLPHFASIEKKLDTPTDGDKGDDQRKRPGLNEHSGPEETRQHGAHENCPGANQQSGALGFPD